jgi:2-iminobutanoate/2-iminopropanoate deaminase
MTKSLPYAPIRQAGDFYFLAGHTPINGITKTVADTIEAQTADCLENLIKTLETNELSLDDVVKTTVFLSNMSDFDKMNQVYSTYFTMLPVRSTVEVSDLPHIATNGKLLLEIEAIAYRKSL